MGKAQYWCALLVELVVFGLNGKKFLEYAEYVGEPLNCFDIYLYTLSDIYMVIVLILGCLIMFSDIPFFAIFDKYTILKVGKKSYFRGRFIYVLSGSLLYFVQGFIICLFYGAGTQVYINAWSIPIYELARNFKAGNIYFQLQGYPYAIMQVMEPLMAILLNLLLIWLYSVVLIMILYYFCLITNKKMAYVITILFHLCGILFMMNQNFYFLLSQVLLEYHSIGKLKNGPGIFHTIITYTFLIFLITLFAERRFESYED